MSHLPQVLGDLSATRAIDQCGTSFAAHLLRRLTVRHLVDRRVCRRTLAADACRRSHSGCSARGGGRRAARRCLSTRRARRHRGTAPAILRRPLRALAAHDERAGRAGSHRRITLA
jgi:hypothetical protein